MAILSLSEYKALAGITGTNQDAQINAFLPLVEDAVRQYTERKFGDADVTETRTFKWDGRGSVEIDDVSAVSAVTVNGVLYNPSTQYVLGPDREPRKYWVELPPARQTYSSEMGFTYNLDVYGYTRYFPVDVGVTGTFGYPLGEIPGSVKMAAYLGVAQGMATAGGAGNLQAESIDTYARSWDTGANVLAQGMPQEFLPPRSLTLLDPFVRRTGGA